MFLIILTQESVILVPSEVFFSILLQKRTVRTTFMIFFYNIWDMLVMHVSDIVSYDSK